jgi:ornithine cyclodeaminase/alanine dehydrogenase-like protein (mu-crystallin family)
VNVKVKSSVPFQYQKQKERPLFVGLGESTLEPVWRNLMALFFHSDEVDQQIPFKEAVQITENALRDMVSPRGVNAPRKRLNLHREIGEGKFDTVLNIYAGGSASYGAIGAQVALHRKAIVGNQQRRPPFNPDQTELTLIYDADSGSLLGVMAHRPRDSTGVADLRTPASSLAGLDLFAREDARRVGIYGAGQQAWATFAGLCELRKIESAKVYSPTPAHREGFAKKISVKTGVPVKAVDAPDRAAKDVDIILCMTNTNVPVIDGSWLEPGQYMISVVGSNIELVKSGNIPAPRREIDDGTLKRCDFIVALSKAQAIDSQQGDIYWPVQMASSPGTRSSRSPMFLPAGPRAEPTPTKLFSTRIRAARVSSTSRWRRNATNWRKNKAKATRCVSWRGKIGGCREGGRRRGKRFLQIRTESGNFASLSQTIFTSASTCLNSLSPVASSTRRYFAKPAAGQSAYVHFFLLDLINSSLIR